MLPVKKISKTRKRTRRAHHALRAENLVACPKCGRSKRPHAACGRCGFVSASQRLEAKSSDEK